MIFCLASSCQELSNEPVAFSFRCNYQRSCGDIGLESEQRFHAAMAVTSSNSGLRHCFFLLVADLAHDAGRDCVRYLVRHRYCARYICSVSKRDLFPISAGLPLILFGRAAEVIRYAQRCQPTAHQSTSASNNRCSGYSLTSLRMACLIPCSVHNTVGGLRMLFFLKQD